MRALRSILKYTPLVVMALLVLAWGASLFSAFGYCVAMDERMRFVQGFEGGSFVVYAVNETARPGFYFGVDDYYRWVLLGRVHVPNEFHYASYRQRHLVLPIFLVLTFLLPFAIGPFLSYRFRLWHCLAYTALVALELAYYLRWQD